MSATYHPNPRFSFGSIAEMGPWDFWAHENAIGLDDVTLEALHAGALTEEQKDTTVRLGMAAKNALIAAVPPVPYVRRPS